jgi:hypothetical protein
MEHVGMSIVLEPIVDVLEAAVIVVANNAILNFLKELFVNKLSVKIFITKQFVLVETKLRNIY